jgi:crotonobetainyl-CoA:carnitine CoA-transferase CaiB-like acyl-CoA transferase
LPGTRTELDAAVASWTSVRDNRTVVTAAQAAGIPAGPMYRAVDVLSDPQVKLRGLYTDLTHPLFDDPMPSETLPSKFRNIAPGELLPAPQPGEHTREICRRILGLSAAETEALIADGVLFGTSADGAPA